ncbi:MAG: hypothetical protein SGI88_08295 [Candidatus Hydrogenedentes bacterium]|nr:hypothetical protein [Candidatus Hydrogenedentota bacterium]
MKHTRHLRYGSRRYTMTPEESATWDRVDDHERRKLLGVLEDRLSVDTPDDSGCQLSFYHSNGTLLAKSVVHQSLFRPSTG